MASFFTHVACSFSTKICREQPVPFALAFIIYTNVDQTQGAKTEKSLWGSTIDGRRRQSSRAGASSKCGCLMATGTRRVFDHCLTIRALFRSKTKQKNRKKQKDQDLCFASATG
jgi:hypothetical protein